MNVFNLEKKSHKKRNILFLVLLSILTIGNLYVWISIGWVDIHSSFRYYHAHYNELYYPKKLTTIIGFDKVQKDHLIIKLSSSPVETWQILIDGTDAYEVNGKYPKIKLLDRLHTYKVVGQKSNENILDFTVQIDYTQSELYTRNNKTQANNYHLVSSSIPIGRFVQSSIDDFVPYYSEQEQDKARHILEKHVTISQDDSTKIKIEKLGIFLLKQLDDKRGIPSDKMDFASPLLQYQYAIRGQSKIWCTNFAKIYAFFANTIGIPTRHISIGGHVDGIKLSGHFVTESFINETNQWAFVDINSKKLYVTHTHNNFLNTLDIFYINRLHTYEGIYAAIYKEGKIISVPYFKAASSEQYYFSNAAVFRFYKKEFVNSFEFSKNFKKVLNVIFNPDFIYSFSSKQSNFSYYMTLCLFFGELLVIFGFIIELISRRGLS